MEFVANLMSVAVEPTAWARQREDEGWDVLGCADHLFTAARAYPHVWVTLATMAAATTKPRLTSSFGNNLLRSPVEFAQAALQMHAVSGGRFEAGLGAGWEKGEIEGVGLVYPEAPERASRYREAMVIVGDLLRRGRSDFKGEYYSVDVPVIGPLPTGSPPPLVASLGGHRTIREVGPLVDRIEIKPISSATRDGGLDLDGLRNVTADHVRDLVARVRSVNPDAPLGIFVLCGVGDSDRTKVLSDKLAGSFMGGFFGPAGQVAASMLALEGLGLSRVQVSPFEETAFPALAAELPLGA